MGTEQFLARVDHLVVATPDLDEGVERIASLVGVRPSPGGRHPGWGTRNALLSLGPGIYLEVIGPDVEQPSPAGGRTFGIDTLSAPRLVTWAAKATDLEGLRARAVGAGVNLGEVRDGQRQRPDGSALTWRLTEPRSVVADGIVPFFIDWAQSAHPSASAAQGARLVSLRAEHPDADRVVDMLRVLDLDFAVARGPAPTLIAVLDGPNGQVELR